MKIGIDARDLTRRPTGIAVYTKGVIAGLAAFESNDEFIEYFDNAGEVDYRERAIVGDGFSSRALPGSGVLWKQARLPIALMRDRVDIFHSMTSTLPIVRPCRTVVTFCDLFHEVNPEFVPDGTRAAISRLYRYAAGHADSVIAISENTKSDLMKFYGVPEAKISVIYPGHNEFYKRLENEPVARRLQDELGVYRKYLLFVGAFAAWRNVGGLIEAFARVAARHPDTDLVLVGRSVWGYDAEAEIKRHKLGDRVVIFPRVSDDHLRLLYHGASAFVFPSFFEGFGMPITEAMACGTPVIASSATAIPEAVGDAGLMFDPTDSEALPAAIDRVLTDENLRASLVQKGYKQVRRFSWSSMARATIDLYHRLA